MSFWSSLVLARAAPPPVVNADAIGAFLRGLAATGALVGGNELLCQVKYGPRLDADERTTDVTEWDESGTIGTVGEYPWDISEMFPSVAILADVLAGDSRSVYRAYLSVGELHPDIVAALTREPSEENEVGLCLSWVSFSVGPVLVAGLGSEAPAFAGWMGLSFSGPGYFFPWEYRQVRELAESVELVGRLVEVCRGAWPVAPAPVSVEAVAGRRQLAELWLYDDFALPQDWLWFVSESG
jgi:hypothetical protein